MHTVRLCVREENDHVIVEVIDSGVGIDPENKTRIFDPFFTTKAIGEGIGLGLSVCHSIVADLCGTLEVESALGQGATFRVTVPCAKRRAEAEPSSAAHAPAPLGDALRILLVDDEPKLLASLAQMLGDHHVHTASSGRAALELCARDEYDVIFCDVQMPALSGEDFHGELLQLRPGQERRIVFMTGGAFTQRARDFVLRIRNRVLHKPFTSEAIQAVIAQQAAELPGATRPRPVLSASG